MTSEPRAARAAPALRWIAGAGALLLAACGSVPPRAPAESAAAPRAPVEVLACPAPAPIAAPVAAPAPACPPFAASLVLEQADRLRGLPTQELARELERLAGANDSPLRQAQLAATLLLTRLPSDAQRAQALLQQLLERNDAEAASLHPLARLLLAQQADLRRSDDQLDRQAVQLRDAQRRIDQLNDRLEAVRALERSLGQRSAPAAPAAATPPAPGGPAAAPGTAPSNGARPAS